MTWRKSAPACLYVAAMLPSSVAKSGVWGMDPVLGVVGDYATGLNGVACTAKNVCAAVGSGPDGFGQDDALVEQD